MLSVIILAVLALSSDISLTAGQADSRASAPNWLSVVPNHWICAGYEAPVFFAHDTDCTRYYECVCEDAYEYVCEKGLRFNPQTLHCDQAGRVACVSEDGGALPADPIVPDAPTDASVVPELDPRCPSGPEIKLWADESNCSKYYQCVDGQVVELYCPEQLVWNNAAKQCGPPVPFTCCARVPSAPTLPEDPASLWDRLQSWMG
uniref:Chitin-binding type-2 domain-containing protein n=1 Tax=Anopheles farauti TaxID=69004 RepID=A0A182QJP2_9DIPT